VGAEQALCRLVVIRAVLDLSSNYGTEAVMGAEESRGVTGASPIRALDHEAL
jgi:hypothetical protein